MPFEEMVYVEDLAKYMPRSELLNGAAPVKPPNTRVLLVFMTLLLPDQRETCCYAWHGTGPSHSLDCAPL